MGKQSFKAVQAVELKTDRSVLPTNKPIAVYYRQSSAGQVGNVATGMQQEDFPEYIKSLGWSEDLIRRIDDDAAVSGTLAIDQRVGMSRVYDMIVNHEIGAVAAVDVSRLFRDYWEINSNTFMKACSESGVRLITEERNYDFRDPYDQDHFRNQAKAASDYLVVYVHGKMKKAREKLAFAGKWAGRPVPLGYVLRKQTIVIKQPNRRDKERIEWTYEPCEALTPAIVEYFDLFVNKYAGNIRATASHIVEHGPDLPFDDTSIVPDGCRLVKPLRMIKHNGRYYPVEDALRGFFSNPFYIGILTIKGQVIRHKNHAGIIDPELFWRAFNYISDTLPDGTPNLNFKPRVGRERPNLNQRRGVNKPLFAQYLVSRQSANEPFRPAGIMWNGRVKAYQYAYWVGHTKDGITTNTVWLRLADSVDEYLGNVISEVLQYNSLPNVYNLIVDSMPADNTKRISALTKQLKHTKEDLEATLESFIHAERNLKARVQERYEALEIEVDRLRAEITKLEAETKQKRTLPELSDLWHTWGVSWSTMGHEAKLAAISDLIKCIKAEIVHDELCLTIVWLDDSEQTVDPMPIQGSWSYSDTELMLRMVALGLPQETIAKNLPNHTWREIVDRWRHIFNVTTGIKVSPKPIMDAENWYTYQNRVNSNGRGTAERWDKQHITTLQELISSHASQLAICEAFPHRTWQAIRRMISKHCGKTSTPESGIRKDETYRQYIRRTTVHELTQAEIAEYLENGGSYYDLVNPNEDKEWEREQESRQFEALLATVDIESLLKGTSFEAKYNNDDCSGARRHSKVAVTHDITFVQNGSHFNNGIRVIAGYGEEP
ncbi:MAG: recombinase family protein [Chloroflexota bacterium]